MKVRQCDICGITDKEIRDRGMMMSMHHYKVTTILGVLVGEQGFDMCHDCWRELQELRRKSKRREE